MNLPRTQRLIDRTAGRLQALRFGAMLHWAIIAAAGVIVLSLLTARLLALISSELVLRWCWVPAALAIVASAVFSRKPSGRTAARLVDERAGTKELFLTAAMLAENAGEFSPIVAAQAEAQAESLDPRALIPYRWKDGVRDVLIAAAVVSALALWLPQLDPLKKQAARQKLTQQQQQLQATQKATALRVEQLKESELKENDKVKQALASLEKTFKEAKPQEREANLKRLAEHQKEIGEAWRQLANERRNDVQEQGTQNFGKMNSAQTQQWREELRNGDTGAIKREMEAIKNDLQKLAQMNDSAEKRAKQEEVAQRMNQLKEGLQQTASSPQLESAMQRAMEQLNMSKSDQLSKEALEAAQQSMSLSEEELNQLSEAMKNQQSLEDALKNLQMAKQLADQQKLDGSQCQNCSGQGDYASLYKKLTEGQGDQVGPGMGQKGTPGFGGKAEENDDTETAFKQERSPTQLTAGKTLLQWKTQELGAPGSRPEAYQDAIKQVKQGVSEAIATEQVPPGYHDAIQKYFDSLPSK